MNGKQTVSLRAGIFGPALLACSALVMPSQVFGASESAEAQTAWAISRVASVAQGSYCTMAQKFSNNTVVTIAQNAGGEYSVAFDFQSPRFTAGEKVTLSLKAGGAAAQTFDVQPSSPQTIVVPLGSGSGLVADLKASGNLQLDVGGDSLNFATARFEDGIGELDTCLSAMSGGSGKPKTAEAAVPAAQAQEEAEKAASDASQKPLESKPSDAAVVVAAATPAAAVSAEALLAAQSQSLGSQTVPEVKAEELPQVVSASPEPEQKTSEVKADVKADVKDDGAAKKIAYDLQQSRRDLDALRAENATLKNQMKISTPSPEPDNSKEIAAQIAALQSENVKLKADFAAVSQKAAAAQVPVPVQDPVIVQENVYLKDENSRLMQELAEAQKATATPSAPQVGASAGDGKLQEQLRGLRAQIAALETENKTLQENYEKVQKDAESSQLKSAGGSWDLEQATRRYQESQREIRRLGAMLEQQNAQCQQEKKDIEYMLFDPAVAEGAQISMLNSLEDQIAQKDQQIAELKKAESNLSAKIEAARVEGRNEAAQSTLVTDLKRQLDEKVKASAALESQMASLKEKAASQEKDVASQKDLAGQLAVLKAENESLKADIAVKAGENNRLSKDQMATLYALKAESEQKAARIGELEGKLASAANADQKAAEKTAKVSELESKVAQLSAELTSVRAAASSRPDPATMDAQNVAIQALKDQVAEKTRRLQEMETRLQQAKAEHAVSRAEPAAGLAAAVAPVSSPVPVAVQSVALTSAPPAAAPIPEMPSVSFLSGQDWQGTLQAAGIGLRGAVQPVGGTSSAAYRAYSWKTDSLYGSSEQQTLPDSSKFVPSIQQYLTRAKSRCQGEFAAIPAQINGAGQVAGYEIACVGSQSGTSASVLFSYQDGVMTTVAHEGRAEAMDIAMDARDRVAAQILR
jgi:hypothetical protein